MEKRLIDQPIRSIEEEALGLKKYAEVLEKFIINCETPITIGIQGDWGIGKTSLLNMVKELLKPRRGRSNRYHTIYFNTWQYSQFSQEEFLGLSILKGIMAEVRNLDVFADECSRENLRRSLYKFGGFLSNLGNEVIKAKTGLDFKSAASNVNTEESDPLEGDITRLLRELKSGFAELVNSFIQKDGDRLVILIDDLDRIRPVKALEFLEAIKNFLDVDHCVFLVAVDYSVIQSGMAEKLGRSAQELEGKSYFDKIIQIPFNMPCISYQIDRYIMSLLGWDYLEDQKRYSKENKGDDEEYFLKIKDKSLPEEHVTYFSNITSLTVGKNPRSIKRVVNYANLLKLIAQAKRSGEGKRWKLEDAKLLYPLACMQLAWPELFRHFAESPSPESIHLMQDFEKLSEMNGMGALFKRVHNPEEVKSQISGFLDELIALVDKNGDGEISLEEFRPIWSMMWEANLTGSSLRDINESWQVYRNLVMETVKDTSQFSDVAHDIDPIIDLFRSSKWHDPKKFKLLDAGKRFFNILWGNMHIGSLVTTKSRPFQMYLKGPIDKFAGYDENKASEYLKDMSNVGHYGSGDIYVDLVGISREGESRKIMNLLLEAVVS